MRTTPIELSPELQERIDWILRKHQFEPIRDVEQFRKQVESEIRAELDKAQKAGAIALRPNHRVQIDVRIGPPELSSPIELHIGLESRKPEDQ